MTSSSASLVALFAVRGGQAADTDGLALDGHVLYVLLAEVAWPVQPSILSAALHSEHRLSFVGGFWSYGLPVVPYVTPAVPAFRKLTSIVDASPTPPAIGVYPNMRAVPSSIRGFVTPVAVVLSALKWTANVPPESYSGYSVWWTLRATRSPGRT